jgi:hypothetical protein
MDTFRRMIVLAVVAVAALLPAACAEPAPPAQFVPTAGPVTTTWPVPPAPLTGTGYLLGPDGYGPVRLGMSFTEAKAAGLVRDGDPPSGSECHPYELYVAGAADGYVHISGDRGVESIAPQRRMTTPEGLTIGADPAKVTALYPGIDLSFLKELPRAMARVPGNATAVYRIGFQNGVVERIGLQLADEKCFE